MKEIKATNKEPKRINVFLRDEGIGSRRTIDSYVTEGYVTINGKIATLGDKVSHNDKVTVKSIARSRLCALPQASR